MLRVALLVGFLLGIAAPADAAVTATFYSHTFRLIDGARTDFPHGFVVLAGATEDGKPVNIHLGFSAKNIFFDVLWRPVDGALDDEGLTDAYVSDSIKHFSVTLTDAQYQAVMAVEHKWRTWPQPSYEIDTHNCVIFVKEIAVASGLAVSDSKKFIHAPGDFLEDVAQRNAALVDREVTRVHSLTSLQDRVDQLREQAAAKK
jgi:hypothetical protein